MPCQMLGRAMGTRRRRRRCGKREGVSGAEVDIGHGDDGFNDHGEKVDPKGHGQERDLLGFAGAEPGHGEGDEGGDGDVAAGGGDPG